MTWNVADAKAKFSELVTKAGDRPQVIRNRGKEVAVVLSVTEFARLSGLLGRARGDGQDEADDLVTKVEVVGTTEVVTRSVMVAPSLTSTLPARRPVQPEFRVEED